MYAELPSKWTENQREPSFVQPWKNPRQTHVKFPHFSISPLSEIKLPVYPCHSMLSTLLASQRSAGEFLVKLFVAYLYNQQAEGCSFPPGSTLCSQCLLTNQKHKQDPSRHKLEHFYDSNSKNPTETSKHNQLFPDRHKNKGPGWFSSSWFGS